MRILNALMIICFLILIAIIGRGIFVAADSWFIEDQKGSAEVVGHKHTNAWIQTIYHSNGKGGGWTQIIHHPERWDLDMRVGELTDRIKVSERLHDNANIGDSFDVRFRKGRFSDNLYITEINAPAHRESGVADSCEDEGGTK